MVRVFKNCPICDTKHSVDIPDEDYEKLKGYRGKERLVDLFPHWTDDMREFFISGVCNDCWDRMAKENEE